MDNDNTILEVSGLTVEFPHTGMGRPVVDGLDLKLTEGKVLGILGESGSGKSMTLFSLMGLAHHFGAVVRCNSVAFQNKRIENLESGASTWRGSEISMIFQDPGAALHPFLSIESQMYESLRLKEKKMNPSKGKNARTKREVHEVLISLLEQVKIQDPRRVLKSRPSELSGGMKQRVMIAMALASAPKILLADEPSSSIDLSNQKALVALLLELQEKSQLSMVIVTHDLHFLSAVADEVMVMKSGRVVERGNMRAVVESPQHPYTQELVRLSQWK